MRSHTSCLVRQSLLEAEVAQRLVFLEVVADRVAFEVDHDQQLAVERYAQVLDVFPRLYFESPARVAVQVEESRSISDRRKEDVFGWMEFDVASLVRTPANVLQLR